MGFEKLALFKILEFDYIAPSGATARIYTDRPGEAIAQRGGDLAMPVTTTRRTVKLRLTDLVKGKLYRVVVLSGGAVILFGGRVYARPLGLSASWDWYALPIQPTAETFTEFKLPIRPTAEDFTEFKLPIDPTAEGFTLVEIPMDKTPALFQWVNIPVAK
jgi:hypothetical protein